MVETVHDFGEIWVGETVRHPFVFRNVGTEPLVVLEAKPHCSCSVADNYSRRVEPGEQGQIPFVLKTDNKPPGPLHEYLNIKFNDPQKPEMRIFLKGVIRHVCTVDVVADGRVDPDDAQGLSDVRGRKAYFGNVTPGETLYRVLRLVNTSGVDSLNLTLHPVPGNVFEATLRPIVPGKVFELTVLGNPPYQSGYNSSVARFETNVPEQPIWSIPISAYLPERIEVTPAKIVANELSYKHKRREIKITNNGDIPFEVTGVFASDPAYTVTLLPPSPDEPNVMKVEVLLPPSEYFPPAYGEVIRIETSDAERPFIEVMVLPDLARPAAPRPADKPLEFTPGKMLGAAGAGAADDQRFSSRTGRTPRVPARYSMAARPRAALRNAPNPSA